MCRFSTFCVWEEINNLAQELIDLCFIEGVFLSPIRTKGEVAVLLNMLKPSSEIFTDSCKVELLMWILFAIYVHVCHYYTVFSVPCSLLGKD